MDFITFSVKECLTPFSMAKPDSHKFYEIYFLSEGERRLVSNNDIYSLKAPIVALIPPFTPHLTEGGPYKRINIYASANIFDGINMSFMPKEVPLFFSLDGETKALFEGILNIAAGLDDKDRDTPEYKKAYLFSAISILKERAKPVKTSKIARTDDAPIRRVVSYINENYTENISISYLCERFYYTKNTLARHFKRHMNSTVNNYILLLKINRAKNMLYETDKSIQEISDECGFSSSNYFSLIFARKTGLSPSEFRKTL